MFGDFYKSLLVDFKKADEKYNSGLFDLKKDKISKSISIGNKTLKTIIDELYYPICPYEFSVLSVEILGSAYEQFLGKTITINNRGKAIIDLKPEVRKAGGVYYTPKYVVDYIINSTIGEVIKNKTPNEVSKLKIVDPACGSGSFLIGAYKYLLDWHLMYYLRNPKRNNPIENNTLKTQEKKRILLNNIFGVDIDHNAVEVTKLSLLLQCMEGETNESLKQLGMFKERVLPTLDNNIKCGNSIVDTDYYDGRIKLFDDSKVKPFNWETEFSEIFPKGFDIVIGNPPYIKERGSKEIFEPVLCSEIGRKYHKGKMDFWYYFVHKGIEMLGQEGYLGFITNSYWMKGEGASKMIEHIQKEMTIEKIVDFDNYKIFDDVVGNHNISILKKGANKNGVCEVLSIDNSNKHNRIDEYLIQKIKNKNLFNNNKINLNNKNTDFFKECSLLGEHFEVSQGVVEATDKITKKQKENSKSSNVNVGDGVFVLSQQEIEKMKLTKEESALLKPYLNTQHVKAYSIHFGNQFLLYLGKKEKEDIAKGKFQKIKKHLDEMKDYITSSNKPYGIHRTRDSKFFEEPKLICKGMFAQPEFCFDDKKYYCGFSFSLIIQKSKIYDLKLLLAILNSSLGCFWFNINGKKRGVGVDIGVGVFRQFPLPNIQKNKDFKYQSAELVKLSDLISNAKNKVGLSIKAKEQNDREILHFQQKINKLVLDLYNLKESDIPTT